jgi:electron transfer flavoprotein alpha subunit
MSKVWVFTEEPKAALHVLSPAINTASKFGEKPALMVPSGKELDGIADRGWSKIIALKGLNDGASFEYASAVATLMKKEEPKIVIVPGTKLGKEVAAFIAALSGAAYAPEALDIMLDGEVIKYARSILGGGVIATYKAKAPFLVATYQLYQYPPPEGGHTIPEVTEIEVSVERSKVSRVEVRPLEKSGVDLRKADRIIAVGRGLAKREDLAVIEELAGLLKAEVGCSRILTEDYKWLPSERQVGLTGVIVSPRLYVAIGISGQIQHVIGFNKSKIVVAINKDKNAPIHQYADYSIVDDLYKIVPALISYLKKTSSQ